MFKRKQKPIVLHAYTVDPAVYEQYKIERSTKNFPSWFKELKAFKEEDVMNAVLDNRSTTNMKHCIGFTNLYKNSFNIPLWSDLVLELTPNSYRWIFARLAELVVDGTNHTGIDVHNGEQANNWYNAGVTQHLKLLSPWYFFCDEDIDFLFTNTDWNLKEENLFDFKTLNGIINYKRTHASNINILAKMPTENKRYLFEAGSPLASLVPLTEREVIIEHHLVSDEELRKLLARETATCFFKRFIRQCN